MSSAIAIEGKRSRGESKRGVRRELIGLVLVAAGALICLALVSYNPHDPSLNTTAGARVRNWIGPLGATVADVAHQFLGIGAYLVAWIPVAFGLAVLFGQRMRLFALKFAAFLSLAIVVSAMADFIVGNKRGGFVGELIVQALTSRIGAAGAAITLGSAAIALAITTLNFSFARVAVAVGTALRRGADYSWQRGHDAFRAYTAQARKAAKRPKKAEVIDAPALETVKPPAKLKAARKLLPPAAEPTPEPREPLDEEPGEMGDIRAVNDDEPGEFGGWPDSPEVLKKESGWKDDAQVAELAMRAAGGPVIVDPRAEEKPATDMVKAHGSLQTTTNTPFELPDISLLAFDAPERVAIDSDKLLQNARKLERKLKDYGIDGAVVEIRPGPVVTMYEFLPAAGIKVSKISSLSDDLAMAMEAMRVRIVAPIPGKGVVGIEIPNERRETVYLKEIIASPEFTGEASKLQLALGKDIEGKPYMMDLAKAPHLLVAGATGSGKSVSINTIVLSLLYRATPDDVRLLMVDPKMLELSVYQGIPHLLLPVVTDPKKAALALRWAVEEMERRYALLSEAGVRNISGYNKKLEKMRSETLPLPLDGAEPPKPVPEKLPYIVIIIDELADLMMVASREVETSIARLAQMARAAGLHLILATQRPSVDVLTGVIKANFPARISFQVASRHDSRTILDSIGAENLLGMGDMLLLPPGTGGMTRAHGAYVSEVEIQRVTDFLKKQGKPQYDESILRPRPEEDGEEGELGGEDEYADELYDQAVAIVTDQRYASVSMIQRRMRIGYNRAARIIERMEKEGIVGPGDGAKPREVLVQQHGA